MKKVRDQAVKSKVRSGKSFKKRSGFLITTALFPLLITGCAQFVTSTANMEACKSAEQPSSRVFLQQVSDTSAIVKWRGGANAVCLGQKAENLTIRVEAVDEGHHKLARFSGLKPDTKYYYSIGGAASAPQNQYFSTSPEKGKLPPDGNIHIWIIGDSGTATEVDENGEPKYPGQALAVKEGFLKYNRQQGDNEPLDLLLLLGDNAYPAGTDKEWQQAFFEIYPNIIKSTAILPTIGNHEMGYVRLNICLYYKVPACAQGPVRQPVGGASLSADPASYDGNGDGPDGDGLPYLQIFTLPTNGELGGAPSGTEQYYSVDYGNLHIVSLDSQLSNQDPDQRQAMRDWLVDDLGANTSDWTVVIFHHPAYSKGKNHDSDVEQSEIDMRQTFAPVFEQYGVDVVYNGHSHAYERSWYLGGHYGFSGTFDPQKHAEVDTAGKPTFGLAGDPFFQVSKTSGTDDKVVYTVAGSSGKIGSKLKPCRKGQMMGCHYEGMLSHPAHRSFEKLADDYWPNGIERLGSVVLDATANTLTSRFIDHNGEVLDYFIIKK